MRTADVDDVLGALDAVVERSVRDGNRIGFFAALYRAVTAEVKAGIDAGFFDDGERMARLDVAFADRYFEALEAFERGDAPTRSWQLAFAAAARWRPLILQHLLVGINAHINLDLGIAAARTAPGRELAPMRRDFDRINEILAEIVARVQVRLVEVSPWLGLLDRIGGRADHEVIRFSIVVARAEAWRFATELAPLPPEQWAGPIRLRDSRIAQLGDRVLHPGLLSTGLLLVRLREHADVAHVVGTLADVLPPPLETIEARLDEEPGEGT